MININNKKPIVLVIAGHDPSGGAGVQADIESIANAGCHATTVITSLTAQNTNEVIDIIPQNPESFRKQIKLIFDDMEVAACKIGMIGSTELIDVIHDELSNKTFPIVLDPIISATSGQAFTNEHMREKILSSLFPITTIVTPNSEEAIVLSQSTGLNTAANKLLNYGTKAVLITGTHENTENVINSFYEENNDPAVYQWERLPGTFHGSGCTLSSRIAALLALENDLRTAVEKAQAYTWNSLKHGLKLGHGQAQPNRFYE
jgi:hydroxymethylpyrimidine/phosphomethylpyrimidine kinase